MSVAHIDTYRRTLSLRRQGLEADEIVDCLNGFAVPATIERVVFANPLKELPEFSHLTDAGNAERFVYQHGDLAAYVPSLGAWSHWDGRRWAADDTMREKRLMLETVGSVHREAGRALGEKRADGLGAKEISRWARDSESAVRVNAGLTLAAARLAVSAEDFDSDPWLLNCKNGVLDLRTAELRQHDPKLRFTKLAGASYDASADAPGWRAFLDRIFDGDETLITYIKRAFGYMLSGSTAEQVFFLGHGGGSNGKTTLLEIVREIFGDYAVATAFNTFLAKRNDDGPGNEIAALRGARLVTASEAPAGRRLSEALIKQLTGGDKIRARFLYRESFEFRPQFKLWLSANHRPRINDNSLGMWRRVRLIPFSVTIPESQKVADLSAKLVAEEADGILRWMVEGALEWQLQGLGLSEGVAKATAAYREDEDELGAFFDTCCECREGFNETAANLYRAYKDWAARNEQQPVTQTMFGRGLGERGLRKVKKARDVLWHGIRLADAAEVDA